MYSQHSTYDFHFFTLHTSGTLPQHPRRKVSFLFSSEGSNSRLWMCKKLFQKWRIFFRRDTLSLKRRRIVLWHGIWQTFITPINPMWEDSAESLHSFVNCLIKHKITNGEKWIYLARIWNQRSELGLAYVLLLWAVAITSLKRGSAVIGTSQGVTFLSITHTYTSKLSKTGLQEIGHIRITENGLNADLTVLTP